MLSGDMLRGHTDALILKLLSKKDSYGYEINNEINLISDNTFNLTEATMYTSLKRLETSGFIVSYWVDGTNTKRKYYSITRSGIEYLENHIKDWKYSSQIINKILLEANYD